MEKLVNNLFNLTLTGHQMYEGAVMGILIYLVDSRGKRLKWTNNTSYLS